MSLFVVFVEIWPTGGFHGLAGLVAEMACHPTQMGCPHDTAATMLCRRKILPDFIHPKGWN